MNFVCVWGGGYVREHPKGSDGRCSGFKESQKTRQWFKVLSYILREPGIELRTLGYKAIDLLSTTSRRPVT